MNTHHSNNNQPIQSPYKGFLKSLDRRLKRNRLGALLVQNGFITDQDLKESLRQQKQTGIKLGTLLVQNNFISRGALWRVLCEQWAVRSLATAITLIVSLSCLPPKQARASAIKDIPSIMAGAQLPDYNKFTFIKTHPRIFGTIEKRSTNIQPFHKWTNMFERFEHDLKNPSSQRVLADFMQKVRLHKNKSLYNMARSINTLVNAYRYSRDQNIWGRSDYWATPVEFLSYGGDCEDFAIAKYAALRANGVPENRLRIAIVKDTYKGIPHAVLIVYTEKGPIMLDNQSRDVMYASNTDRYKPIFSINRDAWWLHQKPAGPTLVASLQ